MRFFGALVLAMVAVGCSSSDAGEDAAPVTSDTTDAGAADAPDGDAAAVDASDAAAEDAAHADAWASPPTPEGCVDDASPGTHRYDCNGFKYDVSVPDACPDAGCGLIVDVHGFSMSAAMEEANTGLAALGRQHGYVVVQPNANPAPPFASWNPGADDDEVFAFLELAARVWHADPKRIHFTGFSQGGAMTWRFICAHADVLASAAPGAAGGCAFSGADVPSRELDVLYLHGTKDALVSFDAVAIPQRDATIAGWSMGSETVVASGDGWKRTRWTSANGTAFEMIQHDWVAGSCLVTLDGHCFPGSTDPGGLSGQACSFKCTPPNGFVWGEEVMQFFLAHPRKD